MARDLKLTASLKNNVSKEIDKIIQDMNRLAQATGSASSKQVAASQAASRAIVSNEEKALRARISLQRQSAALADKQNRESLAGEERTSRSKIAIQRQSIALSEKQNRESIANEERAAKAKIALQRQSALLEEKQAKSTEDAAKRANDAKMKADERALRYKIALQRRSAELENRQSESTSKIQRRAALEEASLIENRFDRRLAIERVRHAQILADLKGNDRAIEAEIRRSTAVQNRIRMDKANLPNTPFQKLLSSVGASNGLVGMAAGAAGATAALYATSRAIGAVVDAGYRLDSINRSLSFAAGGAKEGAKEFGYLKDEAKRLGFSLMESAGSYAQLTAAAKGTNLEGKGTRDIFSGISEAAITLGLSSDQTSGALNAIQQMISKGTVQAEELRGQLGERLPGAFQIAARAMGTTTQGLGKMLEQGQVVAEDFLPKFAAELHKTFGKSAEDASTRGQAAIQKLNNRFSLLTATVGQDLVKAFGVAANGANHFFDVVEKLNTVSRESQAIAQAQIFGYTQAAAASTKAADQLDEQRKAILATAKAQDAMNAKMAESTGKERESSSKAAYEAQAEERDKAAKEQAEEAKRWADVLVDIENEKLERIRNMRAKIAEASRREQAEAVAEDVKRTEDVYQTRLMVRDAETAAIKNDFVRRRAEHENYFSDLREQYAGNQEALSNIEKAEGKAREKIVAEESKAKLNAAMSFTSGVANLLTVLGRKNRALAKAARVLNIADAIANTSVAFTKALASAPPPFNYIAAAGVAASGAAQVATISSQRFARGTDYAPGGMALVGEQGPEMVYLPKGSKVKTAQETKASMGGVTHSGPVIFNIAMPSGSTTSQAREMGSAMAGGYLDRIKNHRRMDEEAEYYLGSRR